MHNVLYLNFWLPQYDFTWMAVPSSPASYVANICHYRRYRTFFFLASVLFAQIYALFIQAFRNNAAAYQKWQILGMPNFTLCKGDQNDMWDLQ